MMSFEMNVCVVFMKSDIRQCTYCSNTQYVRYIMVTLNTSYIKVALRIQNVLLLWWRFFKGKSCFIFLSLLWLSGKYYHNKSFVYFSIRFILKNIEWGKCVHRRCTGNWVKSEDGKTDNKPESNIEFSLGANKTDERPVRFRISLKKAFYKRAYHGTKSLPLYAGPRSARYFTTSIRSTKNL